MEQFMESLTVESSVSSRLAIPGMGSIPLFPSSWYRFSSLKEIAAGPVSKDMLGLRLVAFQTASGKVSVMDARCSHMRSDLGNGQVVGEAIECSFHNWRYGLNGKCVSIPCGANIPGFAKQRAYSTQVRHGQVYFFFGAEPLFELPFFQDENAAEFTFSGVMTETLAAPWYMVSVNSVDLQHFRIAHDRRLIGESKIEHPALFAHRATHRFQVEGTSWADQLTRLGGGPEVELQITEWAGNVILCRATLKRAQTFGVVFLEPKDPLLTHVHIMVMARKSRGLLGRLVLDRLRTMVRATLIRRFLRSDIPRMNGTQIQAPSLISEDQAVADYMQWLCQLT
jgi:nitrite reductase/ring-hydroxylating ferredoxin subunit